MIDSQRPPPSSLRKQAPIRRALSIGCGVWIPALRPGRRRCLRTRQPNRIQTTVMVAAGIVSVLVNSARPADAAGVEDFYKGRNVTIIIGYSVGGGYDTYGRLLSRYLGDHIPGRPKIVPQNMPGAGSIKAANYIYGVAPKDGTAIATFGRTIPVAPLLAAASAAV